MSLGRSSSGASWSGLEACGSVWSCPVCSAKILAGRADELGRALRTWDGRGGRVVMVTLTMRHAREHTLQECWDALGDAWAAASGRSRGVRTAKAASGCAGWVRRVEATWGAAHGWHVHVHALLFVSAAGVEHADVLGDAMFRAWAARLARKGLTPVKGSGGLDVKPLTLTTALAEVGRYVTKGAYESSADDAARELAGGGKLGRGGNVTPWGILDRARAGDEQAAALWHEWEDASAGRRALTWSQGLRDELDLDDELVDDDLAADVEPAETVATWDREDWPALRDAPQLVRAELLSAAEVAELVDAHAAVRQVCLAYGLPEPRPGPF